MRDHLPQQRQSHLSYSTETTNLNCLRSIGSPIHHSTLSAIRAEQYSWRITERADRHLIPVSLWQPNKLKPNDHSDGKSSPCLPRRSNHCAQDYHNSPQPEAVTQQPKGPPSLKCHFHKYEAGGLRHWQQNLCRLSHLTQPRLCQAIDSICPSCGPQIFYPQCEIQGFKHTIFIRESNYTKNLLSELSTGLVGQTLDYSFF
jgi:hypothetical protein